MPGETASRANQPAKVPTLKARLGDTQCPAPLPTRSVPTMTTHPQSPLRDSPHTTHPVNPDFTFNRGGERPWSIKYRPDPGVFQT